MKARRPVEDEPTKIAFMNLETHEPIEGKFAFTPEKVGHDLGEHHKREANQRVYGDGIDLMLAIEGARAELAANEPLKPEPATAEPPAQEPQSQERPAEPQPADGLHPRVKEALEIPEVRDAVRATIEAETAQAQQAKAAYAQAVENAQKLAAAAVLVSVPELQGIPLEHVNGALAMLAQSNTESGARKPSRERNGKPPAVSCVTGTG